MSSLEEFVLGLATKAGIPKLYNTFIAELKDKGVENINILNEKAKSPTEWNEFLNSLNNINLREYLRR